MGAQAKAYANERFGPQCSSDVFQALMGLVRSGSTATPVPGTLQELVREILIQALRPRDADRLLAGSSPLRIELGLHEGAGTGETRRFSRELLADGWQTVSFSHLEPPANGGSFRLRIQPANRQAILQLESIRLFGDADHALLFSAASPAELETLEFSGGLLHRSDGFGFWLVALGAEGQIALPELGSLPQFFTVELRLRLESLEAGLVRAYGGLWDETQELGTRLQSSQAENRQLASTNAGLAATNAGLSARIAGLTTRVAELESETAALQAQAAELQTDLVRRRADLTALGAERERLQHTTQRLEAERQRWRERNTWLEQVVQSAEKWQRRSWFTRAFHRWRTPHVPGVAGSLPLGGLRGTFLPDRRLLSRWKAWVSDCRAVCGQASKSESRPGPQGAVAALSALATWLRTWRNIIFPGRRVLQMHWDGESIRESGLLDSLWYSTQPAYVAKGKIDPAMHYLLYGVQAGCDPNPLFLTRWYLEQNSEVARAGINPLLHYLTEGAKAGKNPNRFFDSSWYWEHNPDVAALGLNPLCHYLQNGADERRNPSPHFDTAGYLDRNPDVRNSGVNPLSHYLLYGEAEGRAIAPIEVSDPPEAPEAAASRPNRIVFVSGEPDTPGHLYRVDMYATALGNSGYHVSWVRADQLGAHRPLFEQCAALVLWRIPWSPALAETAVAVRRGGGKLVFDIDDHMIDPNLAKVSIIDGIRSQGFTETEISRLYGRVQQTMLAADFCTCPTETLASALRCFQKTTFVLPNGFDEERYARSRQAVAARRLAAKDGLVRLGYAGGSRTHQRDFGVAVTAVAQVLREHPECRLVLFQLEHAAGITHCLEPEEFPELQGLDSQIEWRAMVPVQDLPAELARFDINLAPLETGNAFCEAKSELKYFEAALVEVPTVASPTAPFARAICPGETGLLAATSEEWYAALKSLVTDPQRRQILGRAAFRNVLWAYGPERRAELVSVVFEQIIAGAGPGPARLYELELRRKLRSPVPAASAGEFELVFEAGTAAVSQAAVVIPLYNYAHHVCEALESVRNQTLSPIELIVVDDCSTDDSLRVAHDWLRNNQNGFAHVALLKHGRNSGLAVTRNTGFEFAEAPFIMPLDADNLLLPKCLERCLGALRPTGAAVAFATIQEFGAGSQMRSAEPWKPARFAGGNYIDAMALLRRAAWLAVGGYRTMKVMGWEDFELWCRFVEAGLWGIWIPETLARYRVHSRSMLQTHTEAGNHRREVAAELHELHPWVDIISTGETHMPCPDPPQPRAAAAPQYGK